MEADISIWRKTGHFYFALTRAPVRHHCNRSAGILPAFLTLPSLVGALLVHPEFRRAAPAFSILALFLTPRAICGTVFAARTSCRVFDVAIRWEPPHLCGGGALQRSVRSLDYHLRFSAGS